MKYADLVQLIRDAAEDEGLIFHSRPHSKSRGEFITLSPKSGKGQPRRTSVAPSTVNSPHSIEQNLKALFGPRNLWNDRLRSATGSHSGNPAKSANPAPGGGLGAEEHNGQPADPPDPPPVEEPPSTSTKKLSPFAEAAQRWAQDHPFVLPPRAIEVVIAAGSADAAPVVPESDPALPAAPPASPPASETRDEPFEPVAEVTNIAAARNIAPSPVEALDDTRYGFRHCLVESGLIGEKDKFIDIAQKITAMMNAHPLVAAEGGAFDLLPEKVVFFFRQPRLVFSSSAMTVNLIGYRVWQTVDNYIKEMGGHRYSIRGFWGRDQEPPDDPRRVLARQIYENNILPLLDRDKNRRLQSIEKLTEILGLGRKAFSEFLTHLEYAYVRKDGKPPLDMTRKEVIDSEDFVPNETLWDLAKLLECRVDEIITRSEWVGAFAATTDAEWKKNATFAPKPMFDEHNLPEESARVMEEFRTYFGSLEEVRNVLNSRLKTVDPPLTIHEHGILMSSMRAAILDRRPFGHWGGGFESITYRRMTEALNECLVTASLPAKSTGEVFHIARRPNIPPLQLIKNQAYDNFLGVLSRPENMHFLGARRVASSLNVSVEELNSIFDNIEFSYQRKTPGQEPEANPKLQQLADVLHCEPAILIPHQLWEQAVALKGITGDAGGPIYPELRDLADGDVPDEFLRAALAARAARELPPVRQRLLDVLNNRISQLRETEAANTETDPFARLIVDVLTREPTTGLEPTSPVHKTLSTSDKFVLAAIEVVTAFRALDNRTTAIQFALMEKVEGINLRGKKERLEDIAPGLGLPAEVAREVLDETKIQIAESATKVSGVDIAPAQVIGILQLYRNVRNITGRVFLDQWLDLGRDDTLNELIGEPSGLSGPAVKEVRENMLKTMASLLINSSNATPRQS